MSDEDMVRNRRRLEATIAVVVIGAVLAGSALAFSGKNNSSTMKNVSNQSNTTQQADTHVSYKNGTYNATGSYDSPGGEESLKVSLTITSNVVTAAKVTSGANDPTAETYQDSFISGYKSSVVGKKLGSIQLSNISGSSLTSEGFNDAIKQIENQAKA